MVNYFFGVLARNSYTLLVLQNSNALLFLQTVKNIHLSEKRLIFSFELVPFNMSFICWPGFNHQRVFHCLEGSDH